MMAPRQRGVGGRVQVIATQGSWQTAADSAGMETARPMPHDVWQWLAPARGASSQPLHPQGTAVCWSCALSSLAWRRLVAGGDRGRLWARWGSASPGLPHLRFTWGRGAPRPRAPSCHQRRRSCCGEGPSETAPGEENRASAQVLSGGKKEQEKPNPDLLQAIWADGSRRAEFTPQGPHGCVWSCF